MLENGLLAAFKESVLVMPPGLNGFGAEPNGLVSKAPVEDDELNELVAPSEVAPKENFAAAVVLAEGGGPLVKLETTDALP